MKRGRPAGRRNIQYECIEVHPPVCTVCGGTDMRIVRGAVTHSEPYVGDKPYDRVVWRRKQCVNCGQYLVIRSYEKKLPIAF